MTCLLQMTSWHAHIFPHQIIVGLTKSIMAVKFLHLLTRETVILCHILWHVLETNMNRIMRWWVSFKTRRTRLTLSLLKPNNHPSSWCFTNCFSTILYPIDRLNNINHAFIHSQPLSQQLQCSLFQRHLIRFFGKQTRCNRSSSPCNSPPRRSSHDCQPCSMGRHRQGQANRFGGDQSQMRQMRHQRVWVHSLG